jgi:hypothetical protein
MSGVARIARTYVAGPEKSESYASTSAASADQCDRLT